MSIAKFLKSGACAALALSATAFAAQADPVTEEEILEALSLRPTAPDADAGFRDARQAFSQRGITVEGDEPLVRSIDIKVNFDFDSIVLGTETLLSLNALGNALNHKDLAQDSIEVVGHADAKGTEDYNLELSQRRAAAVVQYLSEQFGIEAERITSSGKGEAELLVSDDPTNERNRRVEIRNVTLMQ